MKGLFSDLHKLGIKPEEQKLDLFEKEAPKVEIQPPKRHFDYNDVLFNRETECPVCGYKASNRFVMTGKIRLLNTEFDLRPVYTLLDPVMYDVIICPNCGHTALSRFFKNITDDQKKLIADRISPNFKARKYPDVFTYPVAIERYKMALYCAIIRKALPSEKSYIMMKLLWLIRAYKEHLLANNLKPEVVAKLIEDEQELMQNAIEGFLRALDHEEFPVHGLERTTVIYLISVYYFGLNQLRDSLIWLSKIVTGANVNTRLKNKGLELKEMIRIKMEETNSQDSME